MNCTKMSASTPNCKHLELSYMPQSKPLYMINNNETESGIQREYPPLKKSILSDLVPEESMPVVPMPNRAVNDDFKTKLCTYFGMGQCTYGDKCRFSHGVGGVQKLPHQRGLLGEDNVIGNGIRKWSDESKICRMFYYGKKCTYEDRCRFRHVSSEKGKQDLGPVRNSSVISIQPADGSAGKKRCIGDGVNSRPTTWRTKLCEKWKTTGGCPFGKICCFAHGQAELQKYGYFPLEPKTVPTTAKDGMEISYEQHMEKMFNRKELEKIRGIYADWIEDMPFVHNSLNKIEI